MLIGKNKRNGNEKKKKQTLLPFKICFNQKLVCLHFVANFISIILSKYLFKAFNGNRLRLPPSFLRFLLCFFFFFIFILTSHSQSDMLTYLYSSLVGCFFISYLKITCEHLVPFPFPHFSRIVCHHTIFDSLCCFHSILLCVHTHSAQFHINWIDTAPKVCSQWFISSVFNGMMWFCPRLQYILFFWIRISLSQWIHKGECKTFYFPVRRFHFIDGPICSMFLKSRIQNLEANWIRSLFFISMSVHMGHARVFIYSSTCPKGHEKLLFVRFCSLNKCTFVTQTNKRINKMPIINSNNRRNGSEWGKHTHSLTYSLFSFRNRLFRIVQWDKENYRFSSKASAISKSHRW